ncbi:DHA1 family 2-module integral membrane pump EmrD-like MFS transporter [Sinobacterium caligoides]|uniref:DHA1 family 2-module integral membrane pump EmrD-like MFS transporter n=1 Tax=Sinobacterium caligoides TaxID=933926 RepID=A0A3N2DQ10_9GAMM|nr:multidrug effflux MFS transporter [Sinobacterium caligoides]ROS01772.1 DHA1 family 2-module integral membrane pump EmrD-like MFS transporter [Sinobacterium caligoides]
MPLFQLVAISLLMASSYFFASDMYAPSLPHMASALHVSGGTVQQTVSIFFIFVAISQLCCGPLSERYGRRPIAIFGSLLFALGSLICTSSQDINVLILGRLVQGVGVGALYLLCRTLLQDSLTKEQLIGIMSWFGILFLTLPGLTPTIGGVLQSHFGWQANFWFMLGLATTIFLVVLLFLRETNQQKNVHAVKLKNIAQDYWMIASNGAFLRYLLLMIVSNGGIIVFYLMGAFIAQQDYAIAAHSFGFTSLVLIGSTISARLVFNNLLKQRFSERQLLLAASIIMAIGSLGLVGNLGIGSFALMLTSVAVYCFGAGLTTSMAAVSALYLFPQHKGQTGAIYGSLQMGGMFLLTLLVSHIANTELAMACVFVMMATLSLTLQWRRREKAKLVNGSRW